MIGDEALEDAHSLVASTSTPDRPHLDHVHKQPCFAAPHGTKAVSLARSVPFGRKRSGPFASDFKIKHRKRDLAMFNLAIDSKLRGCDLVSLRVDDIASGGHVRERATIVQHKTGRPVQFEITEQTRASLQDWFERAPHRSRPLRLPEPLPRPAPSDGSPIRAHRARLDRGRRDGQFRLRHAFDTPHKGADRAPFLR